MQTPPWTEFITMETLPNDADRVLISSGVNCLKLLRQYSFVGV